jgi:signal transduction histidine kinase
LERPEEITGSQFDRFLASNDIGLFSSLVETAAGRGHSTGEVEMQTGSGRTIPVRASLTPVEVGGVRTMCLIASDLREQRRNEAVVKEEQLSRLILEQAGEGIVVIDPEGFIVRRSASARNIAVRGTLSHSFDEVFPLETGGFPLDSKRILAVTMAGEYIRGMEATLRQPEGDDLSLLVSASPLWDHSKEPLGCVITLTNITERKRMEEAQARQAEELARSNSDLRQFAYSASHDLREPLRQLAVLSELVQKKFQDKLGEEATRLIQHSVDSSHRMESLLKGLLAYTQATDAPQETAQPVDANEVFGKTLAIFQQQLADTGAHVEIESLPVLRVHEVHLTQLFQNLIGNALKYRGEYPVVIRVFAERAAERAERADGMWKITVADNGIGIEPDYHEQIFGLFQRLHGGGQYSGSGIGLAICQKIVQRYRGRIWVESEPGRGSKFMFILPGEKR